jgi:sugar phosphate isomerase/epimerase
MNQRNMTRRTFAKCGLAAATVLSIPSILSAQTDKPTKPLRLGGPVDRKDPEAWVKTLQDLGYRAAYCPVGAEDSDDTLKAYAEAAKKADIVIAEVGAWSNPISPDETQRKDALKKCRDQLALAERIGANCCVNVSGSRNPKQWAGPHKDNLTRETFEMIVETTRAIIDTVKPTRTVFALEAMPWSYPDSADSYQKLIQAIDRKAFGVHLDPVNLVVSPQVYYRTGPMIRDCFKVLGPHIKSCHAKDILLKDDITTPHLDEVRPGLGGLDYTAFLTELAKLAEIPLMLEHLPNQDEYKRAADHIRSVGQKAGLSFA